MRTPHTVPSADGTCSFTSYLARCKTAWCLAAILTLELSITGCGGSPSSRPPVLSITTPAVSDGTLGAAYSQTIQASGGVPPYNWSISSGTLPQGLTLQSNSGSTATIVGTPNMPELGAAFTIRAADSGSQSATQPYVMSVKSGLAQTQAGTVQGTVENNELVFRGIPYAATPVGDLRWQPPQPPSAWSGTRDASAFGNICPQLDPNGQLIGDEDCLFLNIFQSTQTPHNQLQPVMVYLHGGSNRQGSSQAPRNIDAPPLATQGVIVVTIEYRLGMLGFFVSPLLDAEGGGTSGNYGLLDQVAALTWVHNNISAFGGDPTRVTVFGFSAGSFDMEALLVSPLAKGLFWAVGMQSSALQHGQVQTLATLEPLEAPLVHALGCDTLPLSSQLACMRAAPAENVVNNQNAIPYPPGALVSRTLAIEPRALPVDPFDALQQSGTPVPLLIGSVREEESAAGANDDPTASPPLTEAGYEAPLHADFDQFGSGVEAQVLAFYPSTAYDAPIYALIAAESDAFDITAVRSVARAAVRANGPPVWRYLYIHRFEADPTLNALRAFHGAELPFVFGNLEFILGSPYNPSTAEMAFAQQMMGYWSRFAKTGDPNGLGATAWPRYDRTTDAMLQLDDTPATLIPINGYHNPQCDYFSTLLP
jgi:para-nitrobenzyl esterase